MFNVNIEFISSKKVKLKTNECEGYGERMEDYQIRDNILSFGHPEYSSEFKIESYSKLVPINENISCGECRNSTFY
ncbi:MAG: hypothetical protein KBA66_03695 [Leptospiraceae bacterium]|nr:hypothetical protein [Leptospiraceae bacterium]